MTFCMCLPRRALIAVLACAAALAPGESVAQARGTIAFELREVEPVDPEEAAATHAAKLVELDAWLRGLAGRFSYEGVWDPGGRSARGMGDCIGFGAGPGVQCVINVTTPQTRGQPGLATLEPAMILYGIEPDGPAVHRLQVNSKSIAEGALGSVSGNRATFKLGCVNEPAIPPCRRFIRIEFAWEGRLIYIRDDTEKYINSGRGKDWVRVAGQIFSLRRQPASP
jgi:hypothetical protein